MATPHKNALTALVLGAVALGAACQSCGGSPVNGGGGGGGGGGVSGDGGACPAMIANCVAALRLLMADCQPDGLDCTTSDNGVDQATDCHANGVQVYWDLPLSGPTRVRVLKPDGRTCYLVENTTDADGVITDTVKDNADRRVIARSYRPLSNHTLYFCSTGEADLSDGDPSCVGPHDFFPTFDCQPGICVRQ